MATAAVSGGIVQPAAEVRSVDAAVAIAAFASIGAGAIHAAAIGVHSEHRQAVIAFTILAVAQIGWGVGSLVAASRWFTATGAAINAAAVGGWLMAKSDGISFIDGLDVAEDIQFADTVAASLALLAVVGAVRAAILWRRPRPTFGPTALALTAVIAAVVATPAMVSAGSHSHAEGEAGHGHGTEVAATDPGHEHDATGVAATGSDDDHAEDHQSAVVPPKPYDPALPIDLGGVDGVTPEQQARAENLIAVTLAELPRWSDPATAEADGFRSIGDGATGYEHYINRSYMEDGRILDPDYPESLVYQRDPASAAGKKLVAAMYMLEPGATLETVPDVGGPLTQWHIHNNLCFTEGGRVAGLTDGDGNCNPPLVTGSQAPMIHVWIVPHECGPFAALEGIAGGQIPEGEERLCDHAHGA